MKRWLKRIALGLIGLVLVLGVVGILVLRSDWFLEQVRVRIVEIATRVTGAKVEIGKLAFDWSTMRARADGVVLHGKEAAGEPPLVRVDSVTLGLQIISLLDKKVNLESLEIVKPQVRVVIYPDGSTNFPGAGGGTSRLWSNELLNLKVGRYNITEGVMEYDNRRTPFHVRGENLRLQLTYDAATPSYGGELASDGVRVTPPGYAPIAATVNAKFTLERDRLRFSTMRVTAPGMTADLSGTLDDMRQPRGTLLVRARSTVRDLVREFRLPIDPAGSAAFDGTLMVSFADGFDYEARGAVVAQGLRFVQDRVKIENAVARGNAVASKTGVVLRQMEVQALGANVTGELELDQWRELHVKGALANLNLGQAVGMVTERKAPWNGTLAGPFELRTTLGKQDMAAQTTLTVTPASQGEKIEGHLELAYDQAGGTLALGSSSLKTDASRVELEGTLGRTLRVRAQTTRLEDILPVIAFARGQDAGELPLRLNNGSVTLDGAVTGTMDDPQFRGQASVVNGAVRSFAFDSFSAEIAANMREISARGIAGARGRSTVTGDAAISFRGGTAGSLANSEVIAQLALRNVDVAEVAREAGVTEPVTGTASATVRLAGSVERPEVEAALDVQDPRGLGESMDRLRANVRYMPGKLEVSDGFASDMGSEIRFSGTFAHPQDSWQSGSLTFEASSPNLPSARIERSVAQLPKVSGVLSGNVKGGGTLNAGVFTLTSATANASVRQIVVSGQSIGDVTMQAETRDKNLTVSALGNVREMKVEGNGAWRLEGDAPGTATVKFSRVSVATLQDLVMLDQLSTPPSVEGFVEGEATIRVALEKPREFQAEVRLPVVQVNPRQNPADRFGLSAADVILRNRQPVVLDVNVDQVTVRSASFTGRDSQMEVAGVVPFRSDGGANLTVQGNIDLVILQLLRPDLQATGNAGVNVSIRGSLQSPNVNGLLTLRDTSLYLADLPNGIDHTSGTIRFDRRTATIQNVTAEVGGGNVQLTGSLRFDDELVYDLGAQARGVRVRYPDDVSTTFNANLTLKGTTAASRLTGTVTLVKSSFTFTTDLGELLTGSSDPETEFALENEYLRGMQLDVRIQSGSDFQIQTSDSSLASNLEADVGLRLLGTPSRPVLDGLITINRGEVQAGGNKFTVDRGDIRFSNRVKIEPNFDVDLSTRVSGHTVNVSLTGTMQQMNPNFSSDPPLQSAEIVAMLTVGRDPTATASQLAPGAAGNGASALFMQAGSTMLGQAVSAQVSNKMQRAFGATRVKIDPTLTGVDNLPQARVTWEQQVSKDIKLTYITNLNRSQEQVIRFQWDMNRNLSLVAVRDATGLFGVDLQFRTRLK